MQLLLFGLALVLYFGFHSFLAHQNVRAFLMNGWVSKRYYRLGYNFVAIALLALLFFYYQRVEASLLFDLRSLKFIGLSLAFIGILLLILALSQYNLAEFSGTQQYRNQSAPSPEKLNTSGLNAYVRHPLYFAMLLVIWGYFLFRPTDLFLVTAVVSSFYVYVGTLLEEQKLVLEFGETYVNYQGEVGMLFPNW
ncbi:MAG: protein-S-isoprenylcysteine O-methyltransferase Ste14 [Ulvibacter sp.]|jgi:protein-S-isoprenylcysteine O-methyltransferase Ste14